MFEQQAIPQAVISKAPIGGADFGTLKNSQRGKGLLTVVPSYRVSHEVPFAICSCFPNGEPKSPWPKLKAENCLSMLHAKYRGQDICEEMHQWQNKQTRDQPMN